MVTDFDSFIVLLLSWLFLFQFDLCAQIVPYRSGCRTSSFPPLTIAKLPFKFMDLSTIG